MTTQRQGLETQIIPARRSGVTVLCIHAFLSILVGLALRLLFAFWFPALADDSGAYLQLARNWVNHHTYALWLNGHLVPTDLRTPGYPAFLAGVAMILGRSNSAIVLSQVAVDLGTCLLTGVLSAVLTPATSRKRIAITALWLSATCPFIANYTAAVLTEVLTAFLTTGALILFAIGLSFDETEFNFGSSNRKRNSLTLAALGSFLTGVATLVRPEMPLLLAAAGVVYALRWRQAWPFRKIILGGAVMAGAFLLPLAPWAARNLITLHEAQLLSPRYSTLPGEYAPVGYFAWTGTWLERYRDVYLTVWKIGEERVDIGELPEEAFDSPQEKAQIAELFRQYNQSRTLDISPEVDHEFGRIARDRTRLHPLRTYVRVPFQRALTIWFTPRTELLPIDGKFWPIREQWEDSHAEFLTTAGFGALGYIYVALALVGIWTISRAGRTGMGGSNALATPNIWAVALLLAYLAVRTAYLTTVEAPEPRYVVSCYPAVLALAALLVARAWRSTQRSSTGSG